MTNLKEFYDNKTSAAQLQAEAEKMIMNKNQAEIIELLHSYSKEYELAGQTLGERLVEGFKPAIDEIKDMIASITAEINAAKDSAIATKALVQNIDNRRSASYNIEVKSRGRTFSDDIREAESMARRLTFQTT